MQTQDELLTRWRYLRELLLNQLGRVEAGSLRVVSDGDDESGLTITRLKQDVLEFDRLIAESLARGDRPS